MVRNVYLEWKDKAIEDLLTIISYIADDNIEAAQALKDTIDERLNDLLDYPQIYKAGRVKNTYEMVVHSNYIVVYTEDGDAICILRILHARQQWP